MFSPTPTFPKSTSLIDTVADSTRSNLSIPDPPVTSLTGKPRQTTPKTAPGSVPVKTVSSVDSTDSLALVRNSDGTVPASLEVAQVDITEVPEPDTKSSVGTVPKSSFASLTVSRPTWGSTASTDDKKPSFDESTNPNDNPNDNKKKSATKSGPDGSDHDNNKNNNKKKNDMSGSSTSPSGPDYSTLFCMFVFDTDPTRPLLA